MSAVQQPALWILVFLYLGHLERNQTDRKRGEAGSTYERLGLLQVGDMVLWFFVELVPPVRRHKFEHLLCGGHEEGVRFCL